MIRYTLYSRYAKLLTFYAFLIVFSLVLSVNYHYKSEESYLSVIKTAQHKLLAPLSSFTAEKNSLYLRVQSGDTLMKILNNAGVSDADATAVITALKTVYDPKKLTIGQNLSIIFDIQSSVTNEEEDDDAALDFYALRVSVSPSKVIEVFRQKDGTFGTRETLIPTEKRLVRRSGIITNSLFATANELNIPTPIMHEVVKSFSYDIDFQRDVQEGDKIDVIFERLYTDEGEIAKNGDVLFASLSLSGEKYNIYKYTTSKGVTDYFTANGTSVRKELLRTPVAIARISSHFGPRRHPLLGYTKMHRGVDFAAPIGTPIFAAGDGFISDIGRRGSYGNVVKIRHNGQLSTLYAHASRFAKHLRKGDKVKQGEVIAYVGTTGRSSGPHLHFEVQMNNQQINPLSIKSTPGAQLKGAELTQFKNYTKQIDRVLSHTPDQTEMAQNIRPFNNNL